MLVGLIYKDPELGNWVIGLWSKISDISNDPSLSELGPKKLGVLTKLLEYIHI